MATSSPLPCLIAEWNRRGGLVNDGGHISISSGPQLLSSQHSGGAVVPRSAAEQATSTQQDRATDRQRALPTTGIPGLACMFASFTPLSGPRCHRNILTCAVVRHLFAVRARRSRALGGKLHHKRIAADLRIATTAVCGVLSSERLSFDPYVLLWGLVLADASQRAAFAVRSKWRPSSACYLPHRFDAASQRHTDLLGRFRFGLARWSFVRGFALPMLALTLSAVAAVALQKLASRAKP
jgi:hypothetical protein